MEYGTLYYLLKLRLHSFQCPRIFDVSMPLLYPVRRNVSLSWQNGYAQWVDVTEGLGICELNPFVSATKASLCVWSSNLELNRCQAFERENRLLTWATPFGAWKQQNDWMKWHGLSAWIFRWWTLFFLTIRSRNLATSGLPQSRKNNPKSPSNDKLYFLLSITAITSWSIHCSSTGC